MSSHASSPINNPGLSVAELAQMVGGEVLGDKKRIVKGVCAFDEPNKDAIAFTRESNAGKLTAQLDGLQLAALIISKKLAIDEPAKNQPVLLKVESPLRAIAVISSAFNPKYKQNPGISEKSDVHPTAQIGKGVSIGAFAVVGAGASIGDGTQIFPHAVIYPQVSIGKNSIIHAGAVVRERCVLGANTVIQCGAVIGADGFGYVPDEVGNLQAVPQVGIVTLAEGVEVGANSCIDRATLGSTSIGANSKLDNLVQVGHNVKVGSNSILCGLVGVAGSAKIGDRVILAGNVGVADHVKITDGVRIAAKAGVTNSILEKGDYAGYPVEKAGVWRRQMSAIRRLPAMLKGNKNEESSVESDEE